MAKFTKESSFLTIAILVIATIIFLRKCEKEFIAPIRVVTRIDTVYKDKIVEINKAKAKVIYKPLPKLSNESGTYVLADSCSFIASIDTIVGFDTVQVQYSHPEAMFDITIKSKEKTITVKDSIFIPYPVEKITEKESTNWTITGIIGIGGFIIGLFLR